MNAITTESAPHIERIDWNRLGIAVAVALASSVIGNALLYLLAASLGAMPETVLVPNAGPITLTETVIASAVGAIGGAIVFMLLGWLTNRPITYFRIVAILLFLLSLYTPFTIPAAPVGMLITLELMHAVVAAATIYSLTELARKI